MISQFQLAIVSKSLTGIPLTVNLSLSSFIARKCQIFMFHLRNLYHIKNCLPLYCQIMLQVVNNLILSQLDYCNAILANATKNELKLLQKILHNSVRFIYNLN